MNRARSLGIFGWVLLAIAIAPSSIEAKPPETSWVRLGRGGCYGPCPQYEVTVRDDGHVTWLGKWFVDRVGEVEYTIPARRARAIVRAASRAPFSRFAAAEGDRCATDMTSARVRVHAADGTEHAYYNYHGCRTPLVRRGKLLERRIDRVAKSRRWTSPHRPTCIVGHTNIHYEGDDDVAPGSEAGDTPRLVHRNGVFTSTVAALEADARLEVEVWTIGTPTAAQHRRVDAYRRALLDAGIEAKRIRTAVLEAHDDTNLGGMADTMVLLATGTGECLLRRA